ncbi:hypothetical protein ACFOEZ_19870 [Tianweitania populi]|uniref:Uncharacterized protein n=1 Tax=Tianweitania populi TaxID=1607949 RepID=A0A8J3E081_9HYPH|nr:hypothetical protein GCM10016234_35040 [Tianweitania populi]
METLTQLRAAANGNGLRIAQAQHLIKKLTRLCEPSRALDAAGEELGSLLLNIEIESILGGETSKMKARANTLLDAIEKAMASPRR